MEDNVMRSKRRKHRQRVVRRDGSDWLISNRRRYRIVILDGDKPEDHLLNYAAIARELDLTYAAVCQRQKSGRKKAEKGQKPPRAKGWPGMDGKALPIRWQPTTDARNRDRQTPFVRRGDLPVNIADPPGQTATRFFADGKCVLTKDEAKRLVHDDRGRASLRYRRMFSPITGFRVDVCDEETVNAAITAARGRTTPPNIDGEPSIWASELLRDFDRIGQGRPKTGISIVPRWGSGCLHLDGNKLKYDREKVGLQRFYVGRRQASLIVASNRAYQQHQVLESRLWLCQNEANWEFGISKYLLREARDQKLLDPKKCGHFLLYKREELEALKEKLWPRANAGGAQEPAEDGDRWVTRADAASANGVRIGTVKMAISRERFNRTKDTHPGTLSKKRRLVSASGVARYVAAPRIHGFPKSEGLVDPKTGLQWLTRPQIERLPECTNFKLRANLRALLRSARLARQIRFKEPDRPNGPFLYLVSDVLALFQAGGAAPPISTPKRARGKKRLEPDFVEHLEKSKKDGLTARETIIGWNADPEHRQISINDATCSSVRANWLRLAKAASSQ